MSIHILEASFKLLGHHFCNLIATMLSDIPLKPSALSLYQYTNVYLGSSSSSSRYFLLI